MEFIRKLFNRSTTAKEPSETARGAAPVQSQEEQDATRARMEAEVAENKERREAGGPKDT